MVRALHVTRNMLDVFTWTCSINGIKQKQGLNPDALFLQ